MDLQEQKNGGELSLYPAHNPNSAAVVERFEAAQSH